VPVRPEVQLEHAQRNEQLQRVHGYVDARRELDGEYVLQKLRAVRSQADEPDGARREEQPQCPTAMDSDIARHRVAQRRGGEEDDERRGHCVAGDVGQSLVRIPGPLQVEAEQARCDGCHEERAAVPPMENRSALADPWNQLQRPGAMHHDGEQDVSGTGDVPKRIAGDVAVQQRCLRESCQASGGEISAVDADDVVREEPLAHRCDHEPERCRRRERIDTRRRARRTARHDCRSAIAHGCSPTDRRPA
jgi:hypothetical protein